jgi:uncharacterized Tic20 family protein
MSDPNPSMPPPPSAEPTNEKSIAALVHASGILFSFVVPLVVWLVKKDDSPYLGRQSAEALNFQITMLIGWVVSSVLTVILIGFLLYLVVLVVNVVFCIIAAVKTSNGEEYRYPLAIRLIK